jgi:hypothetical protein
MPDSGRERWAKWMLPGALLAFVATRAYLLLWFTPLLDGDVNDYLNYALHAVDGGLTPYRDVPIEYPPVAYWAMTLPRWLCRDWLSWEAIGRLWPPDVVARYHRCFRGEMFVFDLASFALLLGIVRRRRPELVGVAAAGYVALTTLMAHVLYDRLDMGLLCLLLAWAYAWLRSAGSSRAGGWLCAAYLALGLAISYKLIPLLIVPLVLVAEARQVRSARDALRAGLLFTILGTAATGPFLWYYFGPAGSDVFHPFKYHGARGIEACSLYGTLMMAAEPLGFGLQAVHGHGSWNVEGSLAGPLLTASTVVLAIVVGGLLLLACWPGRTLDRAETYRLALVTLLAAVVVAKVLSAQYLVWALPLALLLGAELLGRREYLLLVGLLTLIAVLTTAVFPYLFFPEYLGKSGAVVNPYPLIPDLHWLPCTLLIARNALLVACVVWLGARTIAHRPRSG